MRRMMSRRPSPSMAVAFLALLVALGGTSYAVVQLPRGSVGNAQLKRNAVTTSKVKNGSLLRRDFRGGRLPRGRRGPAGPRGPAGATDVTVFSATGNGSVTASCPAGQRATGGGASLDPQGFGILIDSRPEPATGTPTGWTAVSDEPEDAVQAWVVCAAP